MNLHGYLARERIYYGSDEGVDFTNIYFYTVLYHALAGVEPDRHRARRDVRAASRSRSTPPASSSTSTPSRRGSRRPTRVRELFADAGMHIPTQDDWRALKASVRSTASTTRTCRPCRRPARSPTSTTRRRSIHPIASKIEIRKEGKIGRVYYPAPYHDERQPGVLPGRVRDRLREDHRHLCRGDAARRPGPVADAVLQGHRHDARHQQGADLRLAQGHQDDLLHPSAPAGARRAPRSRAASPACSDSCSRTPRPGFGPRQTM